MYKRIFKMELFISFIFLGFLTLVMLFLSWILGPSKKNPGKSKPFECGSPYLEEVIKPFPAKYYATALLFVLFDIEIAFLIPWALLWKEGDSLFYLGIMTLFIFVLAIGFIWAWKKGAMNWER
ncbi:MAG: NADH-quinone oxidoreductase subunit A [Candidatus Aminicenantia bacterium]